MSYLPELFVVKFALIISGFVLNVHAASVLLTAKRLKQATAHYDVGLSGGSASTNAAMFSSVRWYHTIASSFPISAWL